MNVDVDEPPASYAAVHRYNGAVLLHDRRERVVAMAIQPRDFAIVLDVWRYKFLTAPMVHELHWDGGSWTKTEAGTRNEPAGVNEAKLGAGCELSAPGVASGAGVGDPQVGHGLWAVELGDPQAGEEQAGQGEYGGRAESSPDRYKQRRQQAAESFLVSPAAWDPAHLSTQLCTLRHASSRWVNACAW